MKDYIEERVLELAHYIISTNSTVRAAAKKFRVSKSTVHKDVTERLQELNPGLAVEVKDVLESNKAERHLRGGMATKEKYMHAKEKWRPTGRFILDFFTFPGLIQLQKPAESSRMKLEYYDKIREVYYHDLF